MLSRLLLGAALLFARHGAAAMGRVPPPRTPRLQNAAHPSLPFPTPIGALPKAVPILPTAPTLPAPAIQKSFSAPGTPQYPSASSPADPSESRSPEQQKHGAALRFDGAAPKPRPADPVLGRQAERLSALAAPWRTREQLRALGALPAPEQASFALIGDLEPGRFWFSRAVFNRRWRFPEIARGALAQPVDFLFQLGDMVSRGTPGRYRRFLEFLNGLGVRRPYLTAIGNHDRRRPHGNADAQLYRALFGPTNYRFDRAGVRFVVLDSSLGRLTRRQLDWLDASLDTGLPKIVLTHMAPSSIGVWNDFGPLKGVTGFKRGAERFLEIVSRRGVARVYSGHVHGFGLAEHNGVRFVLTGGGGSPLYPSGAPGRFHHFLTVRAGPGGIEETLHRLDSRGRWSAEPVDHARAGRRRKPL